MMSVRVDANAGFTASPPARLFTSDILFDPLLPRYGVTADGQRFLGLEPVEGRQSFTVLVNWLESRSPAGESR